MALLWQKQSNNAHYEVRAAGRTRRLYTDGVFHSQYNPRRLITGGVWDLLMLPAMFMPPRHIRRVLVLGVGGGAVIHLLRRYVQPQCVIGVELNPMHCYVAKRFFGLTEGMASIYEADAVHWLRNYNGPAFDMIIDDLFGEEDGEPVRAVPLNSDWFNTMSRHLSRTGMIVVNTMSRKTLKECAYFTNQRIRKRFQSAFQLTLPLYENVVGAFLKIDANGRQLRQNIRTISGLCQVHYRIRQLD